MRSLRRRAREVVREPLERLARHEVDRAVTRSPALVAKVIPIDPLAPILVVPDGAGFDDLGVGPDGYPLPPPELREVEDYVASGKRHFDTMLQVLARVGVDPTESHGILDFGCGTARVARHFIDRPRAGPVWGVDINARSIAWCEANLSPPLRFVSCSTYPHLPMRDQTFDLIYAGSVFTHISELAKAWFLELCRISRPGGILYLTVQDQHAIERAHAQHSHWTHEMAREHRAVLDTLGNGASMVSIERSSKDAMVYYDLDALTRSWSDSAEVLAVEPGAFDDQTAIVLRVL